jgi:hypothetical protein
MEHGRDHDERAQKVREHRYNNTPPDPDVEERSAAAHNGSEAAPTRQAARREAERHRIEREMGHHAAGTEGYVEQVRPPSVTRDDLDEAARKADEAVKKT